MTLRASPPATCTAIRGLGLFVTRQDAHGTTPRPLGRCQLSTNVASPRYQFVLVPTRSGTPFAHALLHDRTANVILRKVLDADGDPNVTAAPSNFITPSSTTGFALASIDHSTLGLVTVWSEATGADGLGIRLHVGTADTVSAGAQLTGTQLGFSANQRANGRFTGFVMRERADGNITVLATLADSTTARTHPGDNTGYNMVTFVLDASPAAVVTQFDWASYDNAFDPHQLAEGLIVPLDGTAQRRVLWCSGRSDPETWLPSTLGTATAGDEAVHNSAAEGIWVCRSEDLDDLNSWERVCVSPVGVSHDVRGHVGPASGNATRPPSPRDLGLVFDEPWQRLTFLGIDTDPSQDPILERPTYP